MLEGADKLKPFRTLVSMSWEYMRGRSDNAVVFSSSGLVIKRRSLTVRTV